jgi:hypothetical protein
MTAQPKRYTARCYQVEAIQVKDVYLGEKSPYLKQDRDGKLRGLYDLTGAAGRLLEPTDWIVREPAGRYVWMDDARFRREFFDAAPIADPMLVPPAGYEL